MKKQYTNSIVHQSAFPKYISCAEHAKINLDETLARLQTSKDGLFLRNIDERLRIYGANEVAHEKAPSIFTQLLKSFNNPFIYVLAILAIISFITDYWLPRQHKEPTDITAVIIITTMILISSLLRFWQEYRSNKAAMALKSMVKTTASVLRRSQKDRRTKIREVPIAGLVPGDIIQLYSGDIVPADVRLIESKDLFISQAILTGESLPVEKYDTMGHVIQKSATQDISSEKNEHSLLALNQFCFMGTNVVSGTATAVVIATAERTYFGSLAKSIVGSRAQTAFDKGVNSVSWLLIRFMLVMIPIVLLINGFTKGDWGEAALFALAVAVGLTPEMLPMIVSANLAKGAMAMAKNKVVVKRLNAIQNLGAMDVLCTDKTGTLTQDQIILQHHINVDDETDDSVFQLAWLNSFHQSGVKNLMDKAVVHYMNEHPELTIPENWSKIDELPFDFERRRLSVIVEHDGQQVLICKGAVEEMMRISTHIKEKEGVALLTEERKKQLFILNEQYNTEGFRVLMLGIKRITKEQLKPQYNNTDECDLTIQGFLTFLDPPKESAKAAICALQEYGVSIKVLTGDNAIITSKICREVGIHVGTPMLGNDIEQLTDAELSTQVEQNTVFAKLSPMQKSRILKVLQANEHTVGFLGDGINDAPALKDADVGISVDTATDIAKETADIILLEKSLMVLEQGVIKGRETFGNINKYLNMTASSNFGNVFSVLIASAFLPFLPMMTIQLLVQNLLYDLSQMTLPWDKVDEEYLRQPRKWDAPNIGRFMIWIGPTSSIFDISTYALMWFVFGATSVAMESLFHSGWFIEGLLSQTLVVHMLRTRKIPFVQSTATLPVLLATILVMCIGIYLPFSPLGPMVGLQALPWSYFPWLIATLLSYCIVAQLMKTIYIRRFGQWY
ncbi:magnesium-translocating P-type ATPase [Neisseria sp. Ec49-e6-T10]|uniref:magnesium-translocating P-type ATPase n=1 Tax=Neisseria sp. Ec49-e6-T10 TaxID=3140744 RepID=UPI003EBC53E9